MGVKEFFKARSFKSASDRPTAAAELTVRQSLYPLALTTSLFFLWGFSYGLLDTLNKHFQDLLGINQARSAGLQAAYFGAYPLAAIGHAAWILRHYGYRAVFIWGLCLYGVGALLCIPAIKARSFGGFCACIFLIGNGLGSLETAANPFITVCGPPRYSEIRINISQAFNGIGTVVAPVLGSYVFFADLTDQEAVDNVQWVYTAIAIFVFILACLFFVANIPEITDADMAFQTEETHVDADNKPFRKQYKLFHAAFAQFCYTGAQIAIAAYFINYVLDRRPGTSTSTASQLFAGAQAAFAAGRFIGVFLMKWVKPRWLLLAFLTSCIIFMIPAIATGGVAGIAMLYIVLFFESICFPTIVALGMRGLGRHTKRGSGYIVAGVVGGACVPPLTGVAADRHGNGIGMVVPLCFFVAAWSYSYCVNFVGNYVSVVDALGNTQIGLKNTDGEAGVSKMRKAGLDSSEGPIESVEEKAAVAHAPAP